MKRLISALIFFLPANASFNNEPTTPPTIPSTPLTQIATEANNQQNPPTVDHRRPANPIPNDMNFAAIARHIPFAQQPQQASMILLVNMLDVPQALHHSLEMTAILSALNICHEQNPIAIPRIISQITIGSRTTPAIILPPTVNPVAFFQLITNQMANIYEAYLNLQRQQHPQ